ncbi:MAG: hypothetical protein R3B72_26795 [Polyangiaceae bacterium]
MRALLTCGYLVLVATASCRERAEVDAPATPPAVSSPTPMMGTSSTNPAPAPAFPSDDVPPPVERACRDDRDCGVARVATSGDEVCCPSCGTTPGNDAWLVKLHRFCGPRGWERCGPLACPQGPTLAVCRDGICEATATGPDGKPAQVSAEWRCTPALICDDWAGCVAARGNEQDGWFIEQSERMARGEPTAVRRVALVGGGFADAFSLAMPGVTCAPHTVPPVLSAPPICTTAAGKCLAAEPGTLP